MWIFTTRGFFSVVQKNTDPRGLLTVRARVKGDLENLSDLLPEAKPYQDEGYSDYPWRIKVTQAEWAKVAALLSLDIDYHNFKDEVKKQQGQGRASVYSSVWSVLLGLEPKKDWGWYGGKSDSWPALYPDEERRAIEWIKADPQISNKEIRDLLGVAVVTTQMVANNKAVRKARADAQKQLPLTPPAGTKKGRGIKRAKKAKAKR